MSKLGNEYCVDNVETNRKLYQIVATGEIEMFSGEHRFHSGKVFTSTPTEVEINGFVDACCSGGEIINLKRETVKIKIVELNLINNG